MARRGGAAACSTRLQALIVDWEQRALRVQCTCDGAGEGVTRTHLLMLTVLLCCVCALPLCAVVRVQWELDLQCHGQHDQHIQPVKCTHHVRPCGVVLQIVFLYIVVEPPLGAFASCVCWPRLMAHVTICKLVAGSIGPPVPPCCLSGVSPRYKPASPAHCVRPASQHGPGIWVDHNVESRHVDAAKTCYCTALPLRPLQYCPHRCASCSSPSPRNP